MLESGHLVMVESTSFLEMSSEKEFNLILPICETNEVILTLYFSSICNIVYECRKLHNQPHSLFSGHTLYVKGS